MVVYDPDIIQEFAERLYSRADFVVLRDTLIGTVVGLLLGVGAHKVLTMNPSSLMMMAIGAGAVFGLIGWVSGNDKAFMLRLQAQTALCQLQIELNTRPSDEEEVHQAG